MQAKSFRTVNRKLLMAAILFLSLSSMGCSLLIREKKATSDDLGNDTRLKLGGPNVKVVHNF